MSKTTIKKILVDELHLKNLHYLWVPYILTPTQKRKEESIKLLTILQSFKKSQKTKIVACDESWFFLWYLVDGKWMKAGEHIESPKHLINDEKIMIFTAFSNARPVLIYPIPPKVNFTAQHFANHILPLIKSKIDEMDGVSKSSNLRIHMDNAHPHNAKLTTKKMNELHIERLPQPPYSPDISPNNFFIRIR